MQPRTPPPLDGGGTRAAAAGPAGAAGWPPVVAPCGCDAAAAAYVLPGSGVLTLDKFHQWCNQVLLCDIISERDTNHKPIGRETARSWLHALGFAYNSHHKTIYFDGHERDDVVEARKELCVIRTVLAQVTVTFAGRNCEHVVWPDLQPKEQSLVYVVQDEMAVHANDDCPWEWSEDGKMSLKKKDRGGLAMVSEFLSELGGRLRYSDAEVELRA